MPEVVDWTLLLVQLPSEPSRHRVAVWRELRRTGAVPIGAGTWLLPAAHAGLLERVRALVERGDGSVAEIEARPKDPGAERVLRDAYTAARSDEWRELITDCGKFEAEIHREIAKQKFTLGELEEEGQSLERLQRWLQVLQARDVLELDEGRVAAERVADCERRLGEYAELVAAAVEAAPGSADLGSGRY
ncbi:MAG TPA: Chromate resistance protein ChrB [Amnibacterium sp.]|jgi:hypothetical protein|uniref:Chromate resistance protein ChrB n=1 Tax=Amnibacterium sp. TaxID=1872496 RepID=UPI002F95992B